MLTIQRGTIQTSGQRFAATVSLVKAIGGSWEQSQTAIMPEVNRDPEARALGDLDKPGFFSKVKGIFKAKTTGPN